MSICKQVNVNKYKIQNKMYTVLENVKSKIDTLRNTKS